MGWETGARAVMLALSRDNKPSDVESSGQVYYCRSKSRGLWTEESGTVERRFRMRTQWQDWQPMDVGRFSCQPKVPVRFICELVFSQLRGDACLQPRLYPANQRATYPKS